MTSDRRKRKLVNITVQRAIALRIASHSILFGWSVYLICVGVFYINGSAEGGDSLLRTYAISLTAIGASAVAMLPAIIYDSIKFSNHMAGPVMRFKNLLPSIGVEKIDHVQLRKDDYWQDFAEGFQRHDRPGRSHAPGVGQDASQRRPG